VSIYIHKSHNVSVLLYHLVCVAKYRQVIVDDRVDRAVKETCLEIQKRYDVHFLEIGADGDHVHFLIQSIPTYAPTKIARMVKSLTAREVLKKLPWVRDELWGAEFWTDGYFMNTVGRHGSEGAIKRYITQQGKNKEYIVLHKDQLKLL
jgi:putative transposase